MRWSLDPPGRSASFGHKIPERSGGRPNARPADAPTWENVGGTPDRCSGGECLGVVDEGCRGLAEVSDEAQVPTDRGDVGSDGFDLHPLDVAVFHLGHAGLADAHRPGYLNLGQAALPAHLREVVADIAGIAGFAGRGAARRIVDAGVIAAPLIQGAVPPVVPGHSISSGGVARKRA